MKIIFLIPALFATLFLAGCTQVDEEGIDLTNCKIYFDGCNTCSIVNGEIEGCTEIACDYVDTDNDSAVSPEPPESECIEYYQ